MKRVLCLISFISFRSGFSEAQQPNRIQKMGLLLTEGVLPSSSEVEAFRQAMREFGYVERQNIAIENRG